MRHIYIILIAFMFFACKDDGVTLFDVDVTDLQLEFDSYEGGAVLNYTLPKNGNIQGIEARYLDFKGDVIVLKGTYLNNQLDLFGFAEAQNDVPVELALLDFNGNRSKVIHRTFSTEASLASTILKDAEVYPHWSGFRLEMPAAEGVSSGRLNVYYVGRNPKTDAIDTLSVLTTPMGNDKFTFLYSQIDTATNDVTILLKTEDARGNVVSRRIWKDIPVPHPVKHLMSADEFICAPGVSEENDAIEGFKVRTGKKYLFDGDKVGWQNLEANHPNAWYSFRTEEGVEFDPNRNVFTLDLQAPKEVAWIDVYTNLCAYVKHATNAGNTRIKQATKFEYPSHMVLYGAFTEDAPESEWVELGNYEQNLKIEQENWWISPSWLNSFVFDSNEVEEFKKQDPNSVRINCLITNESYRYLKLRVQKTFCLFDEFENVRDYTATGRIAMEELEVFVKK